MSERRNIKIIYIDNSTACIGKETTALRCEDRFYSIYGKARGVRLLTLLNLLDWCELPAVFL